MAQSSGRPQIVDWEAGENPHPTTFARTVSDIKAGRVNDQLISDRQVKMMALAGLAAADFSPLIDSSFTYEHATANRQPLNLLESSLSPPWMTFFVAYRDGKGVDVVVLVHVIDFQQDMSSVVLEQPLSPGARWGIMMLPFIGGWIHRVDGPDFLGPTVGPLTWMGSQVDEDGTFLEVASRNLIDRSIWQDDSINERGFDHNSFFATMLTINFLNMSNVTIEPKRMARAERRREERLGVRTHVIVVTGSSISQRSDETPNDSQNLPLHSVRGHAAHYGDCCPWHEPRGLHFGKYTRRVWVPQHARGHRKFGEIEQEFVTMPSGD